MMREGSSESDSGSDGGGGGTSVEPPRAFRRGCKADAAATRLSSDTKAAAATRVGVGFALLATSTCDVVELAEPADTVVVVRAAAPTPAPAPAPAEKVSTTTNAETVVGDGDSPGDGASKHGSMATATAAAAAAAGATTAAPNSAWRTQIDHASGMVYYWHPRTREVQWTMPEELQQQQRDCEKEWGRGGGRAETDPRPTTLLSSDDDGGGIAANNRAPPSGASEVGGAGSATEATAVTATSTRTTNQYNGASAYSAAQHQGKPGGPNRTIKTRGRSKPPPLATSSLLEDADGIGAAPHRRSLGTAAGYLLFLLTRAILMPSLLHRVLVEVGAGMWRKRTKYRRPGVSSEQRSRCRFEADLPQDEAAVCAAEVRVCTSVYECVRGSASVHLIIRKSFLPSYRESERADTPPHPSFLQCPFGWCVFLLTCTLLIMTDDVIAFEGTWLVSRSAVSARRRAEQRSQAKAGHHHCRPLPAALRKT